MVWRARLLFVERRTSSERGRVRKGGQGYGWPTLPLGSRYPDIRISRHRAWARRNSARYGVSVRPNSIRRVRHAWQRDGVDFERDGSLPVPVWPPSNGPRKYDERVPL